MTCRRAAWLGVVLASAVLRGAPVVAADAATPPGMVAFAGGWTRIGSDTGEPIEQPPFWTEVAPFRLDVHPVTVADFRRFVAAMHFVTAAERFGSASVFDVATGKWGLVDGTTWRKPRGPAGPDAGDDHPVTQVSWNDAVAYCAWAGKRLPTEVEWEHAARGGRNDGPRYAWGDELVEHGKYMANTWQGHFPTQNSADDGYLYTAPVGKFATTTAGLTDMGGNVWQWCQDWFRPYADRDRAFSPTAQSEKVIRGGSFLCDPKVCHGFRVSARGHVTPESSLVHVGFRCAQDVAGKTAPVAPRGE